MYEKIIGIDITLNKKKKEIQIVKKEEEKKLFKNEEVKDVIDLFISLRNQNNRKKN